MKILIVASVAVLFTASLLSAQEKEQEEGEAAAAVACINNTDQVHTAGNFTEDKFFDDPISKQYYVCLMETLEEMVDGVINIANVMKHMGNASEQAKEAVKGCAKCAKKESDKGDNAYNFLVCLRNNTDEITTNDVTC
ncbi:uncharacterized protein LOC116166061 [Photinus pyralis]|uniref:uncharacterized protein LOC116166061 n=1 Tax=Photinus pyralis TaxID=7054 RepID=UPI001267710B|nr:uncharacterized protein LOC116166061 [Photinus pyralis]